MVLFCECEFEFVKSETKELRAIREHKTRAPEKHLQLHLHSLLGLTHREGSRFKIEDSALIFNFFVHSKSILIVKCKVLCKSFIFLFCTGTIKRYIENVLGKAM